MNSNALLVTLALLLTCCASDNYTENTHAYQNPLPDHWESWFYEQTHLSRIDRIQREHKKKIEELEKKYAKPKDLKPDGFFRPVEEK